MIVTINSIRVSNVTERRIRVCCCFTLFFFNTRSCCAGKSSAIIKFVISSNLASSSKSTAVNKDKENFRWIFGSCGGQN